MRFIALYKPLQPLPFDLRISPIPLFFCFHFLLLFPLFFRYAVLHVIVYHFPIIHLGICCLSVSSRNLGLFPATNFWVLSIYSFFVLDFGFGFRILVSLGSIFCRSSLKLINTFGFFLPSLPLFSGFTLRAWWGGLVCYFCGCLMVFLFCFRW